jgi:hypothetical protein
MLQLATGKGLSMFATYWTRLVLVVGILVIDGGLLFFELGAKPAPFLCAVEASLYIAVLVCAALVLLGWGLSALIPRRHGTPTGR